MAHNANVDPWIVEHPLCQTLTSRLIILAESGQARFKLNGLEREGLADFNRHELNLDKRRPVEVHPPALFVGGHAKEVPLCAGFKTVGPQAWQGNDKACLAF